MQIGIAEIDKKYDILEKLGEGGMGTVFKARHRFLDELRVIKTIRSQLQIDEDLQQRFLREAQVAAKLRHPHIAVIHDFSVGEDGTAFIAMEFISGDNLRDHMKRQRLTVEEVIEIGRQVLDALGYLHSRNFVHRDISTDNVMLRREPDGRPRATLIDLGLAKSLEGEQWQTKTGLVVGKVRYISPEQLNAGTDGVTVDHRSDLYSFGVVLYEMLTRHLPISGNDDVSLIAGHLYHPPKPFTETDPGERVHEALRETLMKALEKNPDDRYSSAAEFSAALARAQRSASETVRVDRDQEAEPTVRLGDAAALADAAATQIPAAMPETVRVAPAKLGAGAAPAAAAVPQPAPARPRSRRGLLIAAMALGALLIGGGIWWGLGKLTAPDAGTSNVGGVEELRPAAVDSLFFGDSHALIIGNNDYAQLPALETAVNDARDLGALLERRYGFAVELLLDADRDAIISKLWELSERLDARDNLLIYYAGHGQLQSNSAYWQAVDAEPDNTTNWISTHAEINPILKNFAARHILVIADSCYAGAIGGEPLTGPPAADGSVDRAEQVRELLGRSSRLVMTSGGVQPVLDAGGSRHSVFAQALLDALQGNDNVIEVSRLFPQIRQRVVGRASELGGEQEPVLAPIPITGDEGGEFFFVPETS